MAISAAKADSQPKFFRQNILFQHTQKIYMKLQLLLYVLTSLEGPRIKTKKYGPKHFFVTFLAINFEIFE